MRRTAALAALVLAGCGGSPATETETTSTAAAARPVLDGREIPQPRRGSYGLFTRAGGADARRLLVRAREVLVRTGSREQTLAAVREEYQALADAHEEAYDSAAVEEVAFELDRMLRAAGLREVDALEEVAP